MNNLEFMSKLLDGRIVLGKKEEISDNLYIIPVYKVKITVMNLKTDLKESNGDSSSISASPICLLKVFNNNIDIINLEELAKSESILDSIPNMLNNIDVNGILKNIKLN